MTDPTTLATSAAARSSMSVLRLHADELAATPVGAADYSAVLCGPAGSGANRAIRLPGAQPHDLVVLEYGSAGHRRAWLRGESTAEGVLYTLLGELPTSFPARAAAVLG